MIIDTGYWLRVLKKIVVFIFTILILYLLYKLACFYFPFVIAIVLAFLVEPIIKFGMRKLKFNRKMSTIITMLLLFLALGGLLFLGISNLIKEANNLLNNLNIYIDKGYQLINKYFETFNSWTINLPEKVVQVAEASITGGLNNLGMWVQNFFSSAINIVTSLPTIFTYIGITFLAVIFICIDRIYLLDQVEHHFPKYWIKRIKEVFIDSWKAIIGYLRAEVILAFISFIQTLIGFFIMSACGLNMQYPIIAAILVGFVDILPIFGSGTVLIPWSIIGFIMGDTTLGIALLILWIIIFIVREFLEPRIIGKQIGIHPIFALIGMYTRIQIFRCIWTSCRSYCFINI